MLVEQFQFLLRFFTPRTVFMHLGAGDCSLALRAATYVERVYALAPSRGVNLGRRLPGNLRLAASAAAVPEESVDIAYGERAMLNEIYRSLAPGGVYFCTGPLRPTRRRLVQAGFSELRFYAGTLRLSYLTALALESCLELRIAAVKQK